MSAIFYQQRQFGTLETGQAITCYSLRNTSGMTVNLLDYGATLHTIQIPDIRGDMQEVTLKGEPAPNALLGSTVIHLPARYGVSFDGQVKTLWEAENNTEESEASINLSVQGSVDLKYSFAKLEYQLETKYTLTESNELIVHSSIRTSLPLPMFVTHHPIWNLAGKQQKEVSDHILQLWALRYSMLDSDGFAETPDLDIHDALPFNFEKPQRIGERRAQMPKEANYDVCFRRATVERALAARVKEPISGRILEVYTGESGLRFYLSNEEHNRQGFCLSSMPLFDISTKFPSVDHIQQSTCYKLIW